MDLITIATYGSMVSLGIVLGLMGAGGSILTVPILVYLFAIPASQATGYSLAIVGVAASVAAATYLRRRQSDLHTAVIFGGPMLLSVYLTRRFVFPAVPDPVGIFRDLTLSKDTLVMVVFAAIMLAAALSMIRSNRRDLEDRPKETHPGFLFVIGWFAGVLTGFAGVGGGFIILPVLIFLGGLSVKMAVGTSLTIIAANALIGFLGEVQAVTTVDFRLLTLSILLALVGIGIGTRMNRYIPPQRLKAGFGWFVLIMGVFIILKETSGL